PKRVMIHGFLNNEGEKMSKSVGNVVHPADWVERYGLDTVRFFLLREFPFGSDGSYTHDGVIRRKNADLSNNLGNLAQRSLSMVYKNLDAKIPEPGPLTPQDEQILAEAADLLETWRGYFEVQDFYRALGAAWKVLDDTNSYFADQQPWVLRKTDEARMKTVLWVTLEVVRRIGLLIQAVMPDAATKLLDALGIEASADAGKTNASGQGPRSYAAWDEQLAPGTSIEKPTPVFPRHEEED
ncbi:MAG TPA: class I tRNA ligase family protein, partial [Enteractinococcus sp.]